VQVTRNSGLLPVNADLNFDTVPRSGGRATVEKCVQLSPQTPSCFRPLDKILPTPRRFTSPSRLPKPSWLHPDFVIDAPDRPVGGWEDGLQRIVSRLSSLCHHSPPSSSAVRTRVWTPSGSVEVRGQGVSSSSCVQHPECLTLSTRSWAALLRVCHTPRVKGQVDPARRSH
jgi:hypothetical protein